MTDVTVGNRPAIDALAAGVSVLKLAPLQTSLRHARGDMRGLRRRAGGAPGTAGEGGSLSFGAAGQASTLGWREPQAQDSHGDRRAERHLDPGTSTAADEIGAARTLGGTEDAMPYVKVGQENSGPIEPYCRLYRARRLCEINRGNCELANQCGRWVPK